MPKVLVVDDVPDYARLLGLELQRQGYEVAVAESGFEALEMLAREPSDAVLLDVVMPGMDGLEVCQRLKADERLKSIPVILITGLDSHEHIVAGLDSGADDYVSRCCDRRVLAARLRAALRSKTLFDLIRHANRELDAARREAEAANVAKSELLANISHEIRTPMTAILGYADLLRSKVQASEDLESIDTIKRNGELLLDLINELLDLSKMEAGRFTIESAPCSPRAIVNDVVSLMSLRAKAKDISLEVRCATPLPVLIQSDPLRLRQILVNLIGNAIKFTERGKITVSLSARATETPESAVQIDVADTGIGIEPDRLDAIFRPYSQGDASVSRRYGGTGLGLAISRRLAQLLGGELTVKSTPGVGSTFTLTLATSGSPARLSPKTELEAIGVSPEA
ncbi:MAG TPA: ATP-binding protein [Pirellulales bacterium]|nr:ATP-binding protein [Pirellulales bacterium]